MARTATEIIRDRAGTGFQVGLILGSGLGALADMVEYAIRISYEDLPGFPISTIASHAGELVAGSLWGVRVLIFSGRVHYYEDGDSQAMRVPLETLKALGAEGVILTNAAGSLREDIPPGDVMLIEDHINFANRNPLIGREIENRFVGMTEAYDENWRSMLTEAAAKEGLDLKSGTYVWFSGPSFETPAEVRMVRRLGADAVGMSTVPETILARWLKLKVAALSTVTNFGADMITTELSHEETMAVGPIGAEKIKRILQQFLKALAFMDREQARKAIGLLDLTNLNDDCDEMAIADLCRKAKTPYGNTAAICIWPAFIPSAKKHLADTDIKIATVVNFPHGGEDVATAIATTETAIVDGADEIDLVLPYQALLEGRDEDALAMVEAIRSVCRGDVILKVILETGILEETSLIRKASKLAIAGGTDFIKTSTGKVPVNATLDVADIMLDEIRKSGKNIGFKPAGGLKTAQDVAGYLDLAEKHMGPDWAKAQTLRFGASSVLTALLAVCDGETEAKPSEGY